MRQFIPFVFAAVVGALLSSCGQSQEEPSPETSTVTPDSVHIPPPQPPGTSVPANWHDSAIHLGPVDPNFAALVIAMEGGSERQVRTTGGVAELVHNGPAPEQRQRLVNTTAYVITPFRNMGTTKFGAPDAGYPQDVSPTERVYQFTDPSNGGVTNITIIMQDKEWPDDTTNGTTH